ncbi:class I SAM-dependent DNA methyltransferase [Tichowtungia aerotolerans]|uniref:site-specific DNA-methyltransferase (adenine-specific) n=1 Tax=Tichowtungia aerotolerans TaxID=2697043 RepID=A0A6P1MB40_9BACT|nr:class I SAM-dependent DNA methyltransferase [Tichowtungia aerotolerans]QHI68776.1 N-6 DNA methylase [Tichowtungia aerotolerans]
MAKKQTGANIGFEEKLWLAADKLRGSMDASEYKHIILGLIFLKYISDKFCEQRDWLIQETGDPDSEYHTRNERDQLVVLEDRDEYAAKNVFWVPSTARWEVIQKEAKRPTIGQTIDNAMDLIEKENKSLKGILPKNYAKPEVDKRRLGELIDLISTIDMMGHHEEQDLLGRIYEYFLGKFAAAEGKGGGEFYTPACVVRTLVEMLEPYKGRIYDPCCGSGGMFVQSEKFTEAHGGQKTDLSVYGQESNPTTWRLARMNMALRGIECNLGDQWADTFHNDKHPDLKADFILANPPFNISDWGGEKLKDDKRWTHGVPPAGNANFAWVQHMVHHLSPSGTAGFVLANGSMSSNTGGEGDIRKALVDADLVDCMVALPGQLFYSTPIPVCLWFLRRKKRQGCKGEVLFIDARKMGAPADRTHMELTKDEISVLAQTYHSWTGRDESTAYSDVTGFCAVVPTENIRKNDYVLTPGRYVGSEAQEEEYVIFENKMNGLCAELSQLMEKSKECDQRVCRALKRCGFDV